jgi:hypothetical protein
MLAIIVRIGLDCVWLGASLLGEEDRRGVRSNNIGSLLEMVDES